MSTATIPVEVPSPGPAVQAREGRIASIDAGRGLLVTLMIFFDKLDEIPTTPLWLRHETSPLADAFTIRDFGFPAFLFLVGVSIHVTVSRRWALGQPTSAILGQICARALGLIVLGRFLLNALRGVWLGDGPWPGALWNSLALVAIIATFSPPPSRRLPAAVVRLLGAVALVILAWAYRGPGDCRFQLQFPLPEVLGLIGLSYLVVGTLVVLTGEDRRLLAGSLILFILVYVASRSEALGDILVSRGIDVGRSFGTLPVIVVSGVILGTILYPARSPEAPRDRVKASLLFAFGIDVLALMLDPFYGVSEIRTTPSWALWCISICCWLLTLFYWVMDVRGYAGFARLLRPASRNALGIFFWRSVLVILGTYAAAPRMTEITGVSFLAGIVGCAVYTAVVLGTAVAASKIGLKIGR